MIMVYLLVGLVIVGRHTRNEINDCGGAEIVLLILLWPLYLVFLGMEWVGEWVVRGYRDG